MGTLLLILFVLSVAHFFYEGVLAPSWRMLLRNRLFVLRDELRNLKIAGINPDDDRAFWYVHDGLNHLLNRLPSLSLSGRFYAWRAYRTDERLREMIAERTELLEKCGDARIREIFEAAGDVVKKAFLVNMGGWFIYLVPVVLVLATIQSLTKLASSIVLTPGKEADRWFSERPDLNERFA